LEARRRGSQTLFTKADRAGSDLELAAAVLQKDRKGADFVSLYAEMHHPAADRKIWPGPTFPISEVEKQVENQRENRNVIGSISFLKLSFVAARYRMPHDPSVQKCIDVCTRCHGVCLETLNYCLAGSGHIAPSHIRILLDCAEICQTSANFLVRNSDVHRQVCAACAATCMACASSCTQLTGDEVMERCALTCRQCADTCQELTGPY
jgi:hypothetical protein